MPRILIIDDEKSIRRALREILEYEKYEVDEAEDALIALKKLEDEVFDLIFCDIKMPKMDGIEFLDKCHTSHPEIPIVFFRSRVMANNEN